MVSKTRIRGTIKLRADDRKGCTHSGVPHLFIHFVNFTCDFGASCAGIVDHAVEYRSLSIILFCLKALHPGNDSMHSHIQSASNLNRLLNNFLHICSYGNISLNIDCFTLPVALTDELMGGNISISNTPSISHVGAEIRADDRRGAVSSEGESDGAADS